MDRIINNDDEQELKKALGEPKYYIDTPGKMAGEQYYWFPNQGNSMTDHTARSIPGGSLVLGRLLNISSLADVPLNHPMVFIIDYKGEQYCLLKSPCAVKTGEESSGSGMLCLHSYNPSPGFNDLWVPFHYIKYIFIVERVRRPDGTEFTPEQEANQEKK